MAEDFVFDLSAAEVAVIVTVMFPEPDVGALYVTPDAVLFVRLPQALPLQPVPDMVQVTPLLLESLLTVAVKTKVCPWSMFV
jgi:hypothetical protein